MAKDRSPNTGLRRRSLKEAAATLATAIWCGEVIVAVLVSSRRYSGAFTPPESALLSLLAAGGCAAISLGCCGIESVASTKPRGIAARVMVILLTAVPPFVVGLSLLPNDSATGVSGLLTMCILIAFAAVVLNGGLSAFTGSDTGTKSTFRERPQNSMRPVETPVIAEESRPNWLHEPAEPESAPETSGNVSQWMSRTLADDGESETIEGVVTVHFAAGQKTAIVHLSFLPPLASTPEIDCEPQDAADVRLRTAAVQTYGARIEARRTDSLETTARVEIAYSAFAAIHQERAA